MPASLAWRSLSLSAPLLLPLLRVLAAAATAGSLSSLTSCVTHLFQRSFLHAQHCMLEALGTCTRSAGHWLNLSAARQLGASAHQAHSLTVHTELSADTLRGAQSKTHHGDPKACDQCKRAKSQAWVPLPARQLAHLHVPPGAKTCKTRHVPQPDLSASGTLRKRGSSSNRRIASRKSLNGRGSDLPSLLGLSSGLSTCTEG